jgi:hypothetical protein
MWRKGSIAVSGTVERFQYHGIVSEGKGCFQYTASWVGESVEYERAAPFTVRAVKIPAACSVTSLHTCFSWAPTTIYGSDDILLPFHDRSRDARNRMQGGLASYMS